MILEYKSLVVRIFEEEITNSHTKVKLLCDIETFYGPHMHYATIECVCHG
jgi:hypothetical protein